jgi:hypothetical protein
MAITAPNILPEPIRPPRIQPQASLETFGGGQGLEQIGQETQKIASAGGEIAALEKIRYDKVAAEEAIGNKLAPTMTDLQSKAMAAIHQANDPKEVMKIHDDFLQQANAEQKKIIGGLSNEYQIGAANLHAVPMFNSFSKSLTAHVNQRVDKLYDGSFHSSVDNLIAQSSINWPQSLNPEIQKTNYARLQYSINNYSDHFGLSGEQKEELESKIYTKYNAANINQMLSEKQYDQAQKYFDANQDKIIVPEIRDKIQKALTEGGLKSQSEQSFKSAISQYPDSEAKALALADKLVNPEISGRARELISRYFQQNRQATRNDQDDLFLRTSQQIKQSGKTDPVDIEQMIPPQVKVQLRDEQYKALLKSGQDVVTSSNKWLDFMETVKDGSVTKLSRADLESKYLPYFDVNDKKKAEDLWTTGRKGPSNKLTGEQTTAQMIDNSLINEGFIHAKQNLRNENQKQFQVKFNSLVRDEIDQTQENQKRILNPEEKQKIIDRHLLEEIGNRSSTWASFSRTMRLSAKPSVSFGDIPEDAREDLISIARHLGKPVTKEQIETAYPFYLKRDPKGINGVFGG